MVNIKLESEYKKTFRTESIASMFDVPVTEKLSKEWDVDLPSIEDDWSIGLIVGSSGSGKTTIANNIYGQALSSEDIQWKEGHTILDCFDEHLAVKDISSALNRVGFSSPPQWLLPYRSLSNGQKFRADLARLLTAKESTILVDEYTSMLDRTVAKTCSVAVKKAITKSNKKMIACSCHYDIIEWLEADWVYDVSTGILARGSLRRPKISVELYRCKSSMWSLFKGYHYMNGDINKSAHCYIGTIDNKPVAFVAVLHHPCKNKHMKRIHRTVVMPDYQGVGIGNGIVEAVSDIYHKLGNAVVATTGHPASISHRCRSKRWKMTRKPSMMKRSKSNEINKNYKASSGRITASFRYVPPIGT